MLFNTGEGCAGRTGDALGSWRNYAAGPCLGPHRDDGSCALSPRFTWDISHDTSVKLQNAGKAMTLSAFSGLCIGAIVAATGGAGTVAAIGAGVICAGLYEMVRDDPTPLKDGEHYRLHVSAGNFSWTRES